LLMFLALIAPIFTVGAAEHLSMLCE
jgi:hypothetical protein